MNLYMAYGARLILVCLVMERRCAGRREIRRRSVALQAHAVHIAQHEQPGIRRSVRIMARGTALSLDRWMLVDPRPGSFDMTLGADSVLG